MTGIVVPGPLADLVEKSNCLISPDRERGGLNIGNDETSFVVGRSDDLYTIRRISRGSLQPVTRKTTEPEVVWIYLALVFGPEWRGHAHLPRLSTPPLRQVPPGFELTKYGPSRYTLTWQDQGRQCRAEDLSELDALTLAYAWPYGLEGVIASYRDPDGLPAFPQDPTRTWSRGPRADTRALHVPQRPSPSRGSLDEQPDGRVLETPTGRASWSRRIWRTRGTRL